MDINSLLKTLLSSKSLQSMGKATDTDPDEVKSVLSEALPALLSGAQAQNRDASSGFSEALRSHGKKDTKDVGAFMKEVDLADGAKIAAHLLGSDSNAQIKSFAKASGVSKKKTGSILSAAAPLLMTLLGQESSASAGSTDPSAMSEIISLLLKNVDVGDLLISLLGGSSGNGKKKKKKKKKKQNLLNTLLKLLK